MITLQLFNETDLFRSSCLSLQCSLFQLLEILSLFLKLVVWLLLSRYCTNLLYLSLAYCTKFTNKGLSYMANGKGCHKIVHLDLSGCEQVICSCHAKSRWFELLCHAIFSDSVTLGYTILGDSVTLGHPTFWAILSCQVALFSRTSLTPGHTSLCCFEEFCHAKSRYFKRLCHAWSLYLRRLCHARYRPLLHQVTLL